MRSADVASVVCACLGCGLTITGVCFRLCVPDGVLHRVYPAEAAFRSFSLGIPGLKVGYVQAYSYPIWVIDVSWWSPVTLGMGLLVVAYLLARRRPRGRGFPVEPHAGSKGD